MILNKYGWTKSVTITAKSQNSFPFTLTPSVNPLTTETRKLNLPSDGK